MCKRNNEYVFVAEDELDDETHLLPADKHPTKVMVWGGIGYDGKTALHWASIGGHADVVLRDSRGGSKPQSSASDAEQRGVFEKLHSASSGTRSG